MSYKAELQARIRAIHQAAHPEAWPHLNRPAIDPAAILNHGRCLADDEEQASTTHLSPATRRNLGWS